MLDTDQPSLCVVYPHEGVYSETFIRAHLERLPAHVHRLYGIEDGGLPQYVDGGLPLFAPPSLPSRVVRRLRRKTESEARTEQLGRYLQRCHARAVLAEYGPTGVIMSDVCRTWALPLIVHFHGYDAYERRTLQRMEKGYARLFRQASALVAVSQHMRRQLLEMGAPAEKVHCVTYGVDTDRFRGARPASMPPTFLAVGRFVDKKAPYLTLLAFRQVVDRVPEARLLMVGDGPLWEACRRLTRAWDLDAAVSLLGRRPHHEVASLMQQVRAFVQHSVTAATGDAEGAPVAILEAGASGLPVVATRHTGIQEIVVEGATGLLVEEGDVDGMAAQMIRLAEQPALAARLGGAARERARTQFDMRLSIQRLWSLIIQIMKDGGR